MNVILAAKKSHPNFFLIAYNEYNMAYKSGPSSTGADLVDGTFSGSGKVSVALSDINSNHFTFTLPDGNCKVFVLSNYYECAVCRAGYYLVGTACQSCHGTCYECVGGSASTDCTSCTGTRYFQSSTSMCSLTCLNSFFKNPGVTNTCDSCDSSCF